LNVLISSSLRWAFYVRGTFDSILSNVGPLSSPLEIPRTLYRA
jgi:hypothetical protein